MIGGRTPRTGRLARSGEICCQRDLILRVQGLTSRHQSFKHDEHVECPYCGFRYHVRVRSANGKLGGHQIQKLHMESAWWEWLAKEQIEPEQRNAIGLANSPQNRRNRANPTPRSSQSETTTARKI